MAATGPPIVMMSTRLFPSTLCSFPSELWRPNFRRRNLPPPLAPGRPLLRYLLLLLWRFPFCRSLGCLPGRIHRVQRAVHALPILPELIHGHCALGRRARIGDVYVVLVRAGHHDGVRRGTWLEAILDAGNRRSPLVHDPTKRIVVSAHVGARAVPCSAQVILKLVNADTALCELVGVGV